MLVYIVMEQKRACVIWAREVKLNEFLARTLGSEVIISYKKKAGGFNLPVIFRYIIQGIDTYRRLKKIKPGIVLVMNPPIVAPIVVYIYCLFNRAKFIIDTHTVAFMDRKWKFFFFLHRFLARRAILNTVHNYKNLEILSKWKIRDSYILQFYNPEREDVLIDNVAELPAEIKERIVKHNGLKVFMVNRFAADDAWREVVVAAGLMKEALFFITGDYTKVKSIGPFPSNVILTGYLDHSVFMRLMDRSDVVLALTKRKDTVLWSIREIMALNKPFVTTDSEVLRHYFNDVALFTDMQPDDLRLKITDAWNNRFEIKGQIDKFIFKDKLRWEKDMEHINTAIENAIEKENKELLSDALKES